MQNVRVSSVLGTLLASALARMSAGAQINVPRKKNNNDNRKGVCSVINPAIYGPVVIFFFELYKLNLFPFHLCFRAT